MQHAEPPAVRPPLMSTGSAARVAACHRTTIVRAIERGDLHAVRLGRSGDYRVSPDALAEWMRAAREPEPPNRNHDDKVGGAAQPDAARDTPRPGAPRAGTPAPHAARTTRTEDD